MNSLRTITVALCLCCMAPLASAESPEAEMHIARLVFEASGARRSYRPWWAIDYPEAEFHLTDALQRLTGLEVAADSVHLQLGDEEIFDYPWLFIQQVGRWNLDDNEVAKLREYVRRGGFVVMDDFHGEIEWSVMRDSISKAFPEWPIVPLQRDHELMSLFYALNQDTQIPGRRHLYRRADGEIDAQLRGPAQWHAVFDDRDRLVVAINFNMDMGDAWQHADDPEYPLPMTALAYRFAVNYIVYAMTH